MIMTHKIVKEYKSELVEKIVDKMDSDLYRHQDFVLNCIRDKVSKWSPQQLREKVKEIGA